MFSCCVFALLSSRLFWLTFSNEIFRLRQSFFQVLHAATNSEAVYFPTTLNESKGTFGRVCLLFFVRFASLFTNLPNKSFFFLWKSRKFTENSLELLRTKPKKQWRHSCHAVISLPRSTVDLLLSITLNLILPNCSSPRNLLNLVTQFLVPSKTFFFLFSEFRCLSPFATSIFEILKL